MDVVALAQAGFENAVATLGTACTAEHVQKLVRFTDSVVFSFDGDAAGRRAAGRALEASLPHAVDTRTFRFLFLPAEHDPDSFVRERGAEAFEQAIAAAVPLSRQIVALAGEDVDLATAEGRARFLAQRPAALVARCRTACCKRQLLGEFASRGALPRRRARGRLAGHSSERRNRSSSARSGGRPRARPTSRRPAADAPAGRPHRLDAAAGKRLVGHLERVRPRCPLRVARLARRAVPLPRSPGDRARRPAVGGAARAAGGRALGGDRAGAGRRRGPGDRAARRGSAAIARPAARCPRDGTSAHACRRRI